MVAGHKIKVYGRGSSVIAIPSQLASFGLSLTCFVVRQCNLYILPVIYELYPIMNCERKFGLTRTIN